MGVGYCWAPNEPLTISRHEREKTLAVDGIVQRTVLARRNHVSQLEESIFPAQNKALEGKTSWEPGGFQN